ELAQQRIDLALRADVDPPRRIEAEQNTEAGGQPAGNGDLLLIATAQAPSLPLRARVNGQAGHGLPHGLTLPALGDTAPAAQTAKEGQHDVRAHRLLRQ